MLLIPAWIGAEERDVQPEKVDAPIAVTLDGIFTDVMFRLFWNVPLRAVTV